MNSSTIIRRLGLASLIIASGLFLFSFVQQKKIDPAKKEKDDQVELKQTVTAMVRPTNSLFSDFGQHWRSFINPLPELQKPILLVGKEKNWQPKIGSDCIFSEGAGNNVPRSLISWTEEVSAEKEQPMRFDLTIHHQGFKRQLYTTIYPVKESSRFTIPGNSQFIQDTVATLLTGPSLFPNVIQFQRRQQKEEEKTTNQYRLILGDLSPGLSYQIRRCSFDGQTWQTEESVVFSTPICPYKQ